MSRKSFMQVSIEKILKCHGYLDAFQSGDEFHLRLKMRNFDPLVIERHGNEVAIAHTFIQYGDVMYDPEIVFDFETWEPVEITQSPTGGYRRKFIQRDGKTYVDMGFRPSVMALVRVWAKNLRYQGWDHATATSLTH